MKKRRRGSAREERARLGELFQSHRLLKAALAQLDEKIDAALRELEPRNVDTTDFARTVALALGEPQDPASIKRIALRLRQRRSRRKKKRVATPTSNDPAAPG